jgi:hypothetical protein
MTSLLWIKVRWTVAPQRVRGGRSQSLRPAVVLVLVLEQGQAQRQQRQGQARQSPRLLWQTLAARPRWVDFCGSERTVLGRERQTRATRRYHRKAAL